MTNEYVKFGQKTEKSATPVPSHKSIPDWFKKLPARVDELDTIKNSTAKMCMPFNDALQMGWLLLAPCDIRINTRENADSVLEGESNVTSISRHGEDSKTDKGNSRFSHPNFLIDCELDITTPDGYSTLCLEPMNRDVEKFETAGQFIPTDSSEADNITIPLFVSENEEIKINQGDPIAQVIPIKRKELFDYFDVEVVEDSSTFVKIAEQFGHNVQEKSGYYRKQCWEKKEKTKLHDDESEINAKGKDYTGVETGIERPVIFSKREIAEFIPDPVPSDEYQSAVRCSGLPDSTQKWMKAATQLGTIIKLNKDMRIDVEDGRIEINSKGAEDGYHNQSEKKIGEAHPLAPVKLINIHNLWNVMAPKGYSLLFTSPLNHFQEYYKSYFGIVDSDKYVTSVNAPGRYRKENPTVLKKGMPVAQLIPIKRESLITNAVLESDANE